MLAPTLTEAPPFRSKEWTLYSVKAEVARQSREIDALITEKQLAHIAQAKAEHEARQMREAAGKFRQQRNALLFVIAGLIFLGPYALEVAAK